MIERRNRRRIVSVTLTLPWLVRVVRLLFYCCCYCYCCGCDVTTTSATVLLSSLSSTTTTTTTTTTKPRIRGSILISGNSSKVIEKDNGISSDSINTNTAHETFNISRSSNSNNREKMKKKKKKKKKDEPNKQQMMMTLIEEEQRLLWRNETPLDDFFSNDNDNDNDSSSTQNNFSNENYQSEDSNRNSSNYNSKSNVTTTDSLDGEYEDENDDEGDEEIMTLLEVEELLFVGNDSFDDDVVDTKGNEDEEKSFDGSNNNNDSNIDNDNSKGSNNENENENEKLDCLWKVITGTGCTSISDGDTIDGYQHMYLNADGECHYNDFLGYYRAGCAGSKSSSSSSQSDQQQQEQAQQSIEPQRKERLGIPPPYDFVTATTTSRKTNNENSYDKSSSNNATIKLQHVFCADPTCSIGCLQESVIRPQIHYTSHFCYTSGFYDGGQPGYGFDDEDIDDDNFDTYSADYNNNQKKSVEADIQNTSYQFSFEFVGSCDIQNEMCNIIE